MTQDEINRIAEAAVRETFLKLGVDISRPESIQAMQADFAFMRRQRKAGEAFKQNALRTFWYVLGGLILGFISWVAASMGWHGHIGHT
jgi:hypothetical protein